MTKGKSNKKYGFTLIELLTAVIIIAVLAAVAVPQYKKAVLKSRYSTLMPVANSLAKGNEVYYLSQGEYSTEESKLDVEGQVSAPEGTEIVLETDPEYLSYVRVSNESKVPNARYVVYQQHSKNFAGTTMCEAKDDTAKELCQSLGGVFVSDNGTEAEWTAYLLSGELVAGDAFTEETNNEGGCNFDNKPATSQACSCGVQTRSVTCNTTTGEWATGNWSECPADNGICSYENSSECNSGSCSGYVFTDSACGGTEEGSCSNNVYQGDSYCATSRSEPSCNGGVYQGTSYCWAFANNSCNDATFKAGTFCIINPGLPNSCSGTYEPGAWCAGMSWSDGGRGVCPAGTPSGSVWGSPDGLCWDGEGGKVDCSLFNE